MGTKNLGRKKQEALGKRAVVGKDESKIQNLPADWIFHSCRIGYDDLSVFAKNGSFKAQLEGTGLNSFCGL
jgi:hypothetical protein